MKTYFLTTVTMYYTEPDAELGMNYRNSGKKDSKGDDIWETTESKRGPKDVSRELLRLSSDGVDLEAISRSIQKAHKNAKAV